MTNDHVNYARLVPVKFSAYKVNNKQFCRVRISYWINDTCTPIWLVETQSCLVVKFNHQMDCVFNPQQLRFELPLLASYMLTLYYVAEIEVQEMFIAESFKSMKKIHEIQIPDSHYRRSKSL